LPALPGHADQDLPRSTTKEEEDPNLPSRTQVEKVCHPRRGQRGLGERTHLGYNYFSRKVLNLFHEFTRSIMHPKHNKIYIEVFTPHNDYYCSQGEPPTCRYRRFLTDSGMTLLMTILKSPYTCCKDHSMEAATRRIPALLNTTGRRSGK
jgi:hypothetical protein